jgi:hypothetical protein
MDLEKPAIKRFKINLSNIPSNVWGNYCRERHSNLYYRLDKEYHFETSFTTWGVVLDFESEAHYNWFILRFS